MRAPPNPLTVAIRREHPGRVWERRAPLSPVHVARLVKEHEVRVLVQPCARRVWSMREFTQAGAEAHDTLDPAHIILGVKEPPLDELRLLANRVRAPYAPASPTVDATSAVERTHMLFSHTAKGQSYNMPLLDTFLHPQSPRLIDFELLTRQVPDPSSVNDTFAEQKGREERTVGFGWFAGVAGALESLVALGERSLELGAGSPFLHTPRPHTHPSLSSLHAALCAVGVQIAADGTPESLGPCIIGVTGSGNVSRGALATLALLPVEYVSASQLPQLVRDPETDRRKVYVVHIKPEDHLRRKHGAVGSWNKAEYYDSPGGWESVFSDTIAPYLSMLINGAGWTPGFPRLVSNSQLPTLLSRAREVGSGRFAVVGDISCDVEGGLEFTTHATTLTAPCFTVRPDPALPGVRVMSVDILPTTLPKDASEAFADGVWPYLMALIGEYRGKPPAQDSAEEKIRDALDRATVARGGKLLGKHVWLEGEVQKWKEGTSVDGGADAVPKTVLRERKKRVLMLGSGMVAGPAVDELCSRGDIELVVGSNLFAEAEALVAGHRDAKAVSVDMGPNGLDRVRELISEADIVISLLPASMHAGVAEICIDKRKHMVTASYISPAMKALHSRAVASSVLILNEIGLDPGIDHCSATALLNQLRADHKRVVSFTSFCGGLPSPESLKGDGTGLGYKFSWSPRGVLGAALNGARFKLMNKDWDIPKEDILHTHFPSVPIGGEANVLKLEGIANRDSLSYADTYDLGSASGLRTLLRGTLRYPGFCDLMHSFKQIGLLEVESKIPLEHWADLTRQALVVKLGTPIPADRASVLSALAAVVPQHYTAPLVSALEWLGLFPTSSSPLPFSLPNLPTPPIDLFTSVLAHKLKYAPHERDLVVLAHEVVSQAAVGAPEEVHTSSLVAYGTPRASAMARTVGLPVAFAARAILEGRVVMRGVQGPSSEETVWRGVLTGLESVGLGMVEGVSTRGMEGVLAEGLQNRAAVV
ncbi:hypothetical protein PLICRDRAFT_34485 [Plicaturopsis crispa FD-325 SS-3]|nr:hypothetical protein PLICRDRAFT_34485 [Plicaturopsis crispa FD-325 SS-3]